MIKLKLPGSSIGLSGTLSCNNNSVWFSKNAGKRRELLSCGGFCISARSEIHTMGPPSLIVFCFLATNMSRHYKQGGYMNIHPYSFLTIDRKKRSGETAVNHDQQQKYYLLKVCLRMSILSKI